MVTMKTLFQCIDRLSWHMIPNIKIRRSHDDYDNSYTGRTASLLLNGPRYLIKSPGTTLVLVLLLDYLYIIYPYITIYHVYGI